MKIKIIRSKNNSKKYGKISKIEFGNGSEVYISKVGWNITLPKNKKHMDLIKKKNKIEINLSFSEINAILEESVRIGYGSPNIEEEDTIHN